MLKHSSSIISTLSLSLFLCVYMYLQWEQVEYFDNKVICDLVEEKHQGILAVLVRHLYILYMCSVFCMLIYIRVYTHACACMQVSIYHPYYMYPCSGDKLGCDIVRSDHCVLVWDTMYMYRCSYIVRIMSIMS